jgi:MFS family permease
MLVRSCDRVRAIKIDGMTANATQRLFADRNFRLYTIASVVSWLSFFAQTLAISWLTWELTHSPTWLAIITLIDTAPYFIFGPWGSVMSDRYDRHKVLLVGYSFALLQALLLAGTSMAGVLSIGVLSMLAFMHGTVHSFSVPAAYGLLPRAVHKENLSAAIAFSSSYRTLAMFAGPAVPGVLLATGPVYVSFLFNALGYVVYLWMLRLMRLPLAPVAPRSGKSFYGDYVDGLRYSLTHPLISLLLVLTFFNDGLRGLNVRLLPAFVDRLFTSSTSGLAILAGATGIGAAAASVWLSLDRRPDLVGRIIQWGFAAAIAATVLFAATGNTWVAISARVLFGLAAEAVLTSNLILMQSNVDDAYRSRVIGLWFLVSQFSNVSLLAVGPLAERFGLNVPVYGFSSIALLVLVIFWRSFARGR